MSPVAGSDPARDDRDHRTRLVIGVTGHRDIAADDERLRNTIVTELDRLHEETPDRRAVVLSSLAEGADRLVARLAIDHLAAELVAVLPVPPQEYRRDFRSAASRREFDSLLEEASRRVALYDRDVQDDSFRGAARTRQYARAGAYIVEQSTVLLAIWDGRPARGIGGTAQVVRWMIAGTIPPRFSLRWPGDEPPTMRVPGRVVHIDPGTYQVADLGGPRRSAAEDSGTPV